jgi:hypothetical protein
MEFTVILPAYIDGSAVTSKLLIAISKKPTVPNINIQRDISFFSDTLQRMEINIVDWA